MKSLLRTKIITLFISLLFLLLPFISIVGGASSDEQNYGTLTLQDDQHTYIPSYIPVGFNLKENNELSPEQSPPDNTDSSAICPNGYSAIWSGLIFRYGPTEWREVGIWETRKISKALQATGVVNFRIWVAFFGGSSPSVSEFEFTWLRNDETIASKQVDVNIRTGMEPYLIDTPANLINQTPFEIGDTFKLHIRCRINQDGARILYGSLVHNSHVEMTCDPLDIHQIKANQNGLTGLYSDVFHVRYTSMTFYGKIDDKLIIDPPQYGLVTIENANFVSVSWLQKIPYGNHEIEFGISYIPNDNTSVVLLAESIRLEKEKEPTFLGISMVIWNYIIYIIILVVIIAIVVSVYNRWQDKKLLEEFDDEDF